jgi:CheY-like chemotaxis protein
MQPIVTPLELSDRMRHSVLVVDDDAALRHILTRFLRHEGFSVEAVTNGAEALAHLRGGARPDVILLDLRMPVMDGWAFRSAQRSEETLSRIPVIVLAGADAERVFEIDPVVAFAKPVRMVEVVKGL